MRMFEALHVFVSCASLLRGPYRAFASLNQISRRAGVSDDKLRRVVEGMAVEANDPLMVLKGRQWVLTQAGEVILARTEALLAAFRALRTTPKSKS